MTSPSMSFLFRQLIVRRAAVNLILIGKESCANRWQLSQRSLNTCALKSTSSERTIGCGKGSLLLFNSIPNCDVNCGCNYDLIAGFKTYSACNQNADSEKEALAGEKVLRVKLASTRLDAVLKAGLSMSRNKIEKALYEDRIRVNGARPSKKSQSVEVGDEIDIVRGYNKLNPDNFIDVNRVEVAELGDEEGDSDSSDSDSDDEKQSSKIPAVLKRSKMLTIQNYTPAWKGSSGEF